MPQHATPAPDVVLAPSDVDLLEIAWAAREAPRLELDTARLEPGATRVRLLDAENTPIARAELDEPARGGWVAVDLEPLQPLAPVPGLLGAADLRLPTERLADRTLALVHRMPTALELAAEPEVWAVLAARGEGIDRVAHAAVVGLRAVRDAGGTRGDVVVVPSWRPGRGVLRPADGGTPQHVLTTYLGTGPVAAVVGEPADDDARSVAHVALAAAYPGPALPALVPADATAHGAVVLFSGLSGSGKSTVAKALAARLAVEDSREVTLLDGDEVRQMLSAGLGFDRASRELNVTRIGYVAALVARHGGIAVAAPIAPFSATRAEVRRMAQAAGTFLLVHVATPLEVCESRDRKGLYARARAGEIPEFTGISSPYEEPDDADVVVDTSRVTVEAAVDEVLAALRAK